MYMYVSAPCGGAPTETTKTQREACHPRRERERERERATKIFGDKRRKREISFAIIIIIIIITIIIIRISTRIAGVWTVRRAASVLVFFWYCIVSPSLSAPSHPSIHPTVAGEGRNSKQFFFLFFPFHDTNDSKDNSFRLLFLYFSFSPSRYRIVSTTHTALVLHGP